MHGMFHYDNLFGRKEWNSDNLPGLICAFLAQNQRIWKKWQKSGGNLLINRGSSLF
jgi:hypothetical protein